MKRVFVILALVAMMVLLVMPVYGLSKNTFQDFTLHGDLAYTGTPEYYINPTTGQVYYILGPANYIQTTSNTPFQYVAFESPSDQTAVYLFDAIPATVTMWNPYTVGYGWNFAGRTEFKVSGGTIYRYTNGVLGITDGTFAYNPAGLRVWYNVYGSKIKNLVVSGTDHHITSSLPSNWTVIRDLLDSSSTGVYAQNPSTGAWVLKNSMHLYVDADKESTLPEQVHIRTSGGTIINTTTVSAVHTLIQYNLTQFLNTPSSEGVTIPDGQYMVYFDGTTDFYADTFWVTSNGATLNFDKTEYASGDAAAMSYVISPAYFTTDYTYSLSVQDVYGTVKSTQTVSAATGTKYITNLDSTNYPPGVYYAVLKATKVSDGTVSIMAYDTMETIAYIVFNGYVMNAQTGAGLSSAAVNITQGTSTLVSTSGSGGIWNSSNLWVKDAAINITTVKTGYTTDVRLFTPLSSKTIALNISLVPNPATNTSNSIGGIVRDNVYGNPVINATVFAKNTTQQLTNTSNIAGFYRHDNLNMTYDIWGMKAAFSNSSISTKNASISTFNRTDLIMAPTFTLTANIVDSVTGAPIPVVNVTDSLGYVTATTTGTYIRTYDYSVVVLYLTTPGYYSKSVSYVIDEDRTETIEMTVDNSLDPVAPVQQVFPKYVTFHVKDGSLFGAPLTEVGINVTGISTSTGNWDWMAQLLGLPLDEVPINSAPLYQSTDSLGRATFYIIPTAKYNITFTKPGYTIPPMILVPQDDDYIVTATSATSPFFRDGVDELSAINITVTSTLYNSSHAFLNFTYYDSTGHTTGGTVRVLQKSDTAWVGPTTMANWPVTGSSFSNSTVIVHIQQVSGYIDANITHSDFGRVVRSYPYAFNSVPVQFLGFGSDITLIVALGIMLFTMMLGGAAHGRVLAVIVAIEGWIMYTMHWFQALFDRGVPETMFILALSLMFILGILANILMRKKRGI